MNKGIAFLFFIILVLLLVWNCLPLAYNYQKNVFSSEIEDYPILLISESSGSLDSLKVRMLNIDYVENIEIERDSVISEKLIEIYKLDNARNILTKYDLPDVMKIYISGIQFNLESLDDFDLLMKNEFPELNYKYNTKPLFDLEIKRDILLKVFYIAFLIMILITILIVGFLRFHFEIQKNTYWKIFREAGGYSNHRNKQYWMNTLLLLFVPLALVAGSYYVLNFYGLIPLVIYPIFFGIQFLTLLCSSLLTKIFLGTKF